MDAREYKLIFTGPMGAGKTTAIRTVSDIQAIATEVSNNDRAQCDKETTTVAMDYGEVMLSGGAKLRLYGTPGQARFAYMWSILARGAVGVIVILDGSRTDALKDLQEYTSHFVDVVGQDRLVVAVGRIESSKISLADFNHCAQDLGIAVPVVTADVRHREDVLMLLEILFSKVEIASAFAPVDGGATAS